MPKVIFFIGFFTSGIAMMLLLLQKIIIFNIRKVWERKKVIQEKKEEILKKTTEKKINFENFDNDKEEELVGINEKGATEKKIKSTNRSEIIKMLRRSETLVSRGNLMEAKTILIEILAIDPENIDVNSQLAVVYLKSSEFIKSETIFRKILLSRPNDTKILTNFALSILEQKNPEKIPEAIKNLQKAAEIDSKNPHRYSNVGQAMFFIGELEDAEKNFRKAIQFSPRNLEFLFFLADTLIAQEKFSEAKKVFYKILEISPFNSDAKAEIQKIENMGF